MIFFLIFFFKHSLKCTWTHLNCSCEGVVSGTRQTCLNSPCYLGCKRNALYECRDSWFCSLWHHMQPWKTRSQTGKACFLTLGSVPVRPSLHKAYTGWLGVVSGWILAPGQQIWITYYLLLVHVLLCENFTIFLNKKY